MSTLNFPHSGNYLWEQEHLGWQRYYLTEMNTYQFSLLPPYHAKELDGGTIKEISDHLF